MIIDCGMCEMRHTTTCDDCVVSALVAPNGILDLAQAENAAIVELSRAGLVLPIRLVAKKSDSSAAS